MSSKEWGLPLDEELTIYFGSGCKGCLHTGYHGRTGVFEILRTDENYRNVVSGSATQNLLDEAAERDDMLSMRDHAISLVKEGGTQHSTSCCGSSEAQRAGIFSESR